MNSGVNLLCGFIFNLIVEDFYLEPEGLHLNKTSIQSFALICYVLFIYLRSSRDEFAKMNIEYKQMKITLNIIYHLI